MTAEVDPRRTFQHMRLEADGALRVIILDRPPLNVLDIVMLEELANAVANVRRDPDAAVLLLTGGGKAFCAGVDVADHAADRVNKMIAVLHHALTALMELDIPVIAALNGAALGGGFELALACDMIVAKEGAKLGQPEIRLGVFPPFAAAVLPRLVGRAHALDLCLSGRTFTAWDGLGLGLVQHIYPEEGFPGAARAYAHQLADLSAPVLRLTKRAVVEGLEVPLAEASRNANRLYLDELMCLGDAREGLAAFAEKRPPVWKGA